MPNSLELSSEWKPFMADEPPEILPKFNPCSYL